MVARQVRSVIAYKESDTYYQQYRVRCQRADSAKDMSSNIHTYKINVIISVFFILLLSFCVAGCSDQVILPSADQLMEFENTSLLSPAVDIGHLVKVETAELTYRVAPGEVLEITMPAIFQAVSDIDTDWTENRIPINCRVSEKGTINLPLIGQIIVAGKTLAQTESAVIDAYYPEHAVIRPSVFVRVLEYKMAKMSISGAVRQPGIYSLRSDEMSLFTLLMKAGGIVDEGADLIRVLRDDEQDQNSLTANVKEWSWISSEPAKRAYYAHNGKNPTTNKTVFSNTGQGMLALKQGPTTNMTTHQTFPEMQYLRQSRKIKKEAKPLERKNSRDLIVPVSRLNIPSADIRLRDGDSVIVEPRKVLLFTVLGLVNSPGSFPYPANVNYSLMQVIGFAGGLNLVAEPRYATVYRLRRDGTIISAIIQVVNTGNGSMLTDALNFRIKSGDIVSIEHTPRTRTKVFLDGIFRLNFGAYYRLDEAWSE